MKNQHEECEFMPDKLDSMEQHNKEFKISIFKVKYTYFTLYIFNILILKMK